MALTIGDFARIGEVSPRMLRHYDRLGLLRPARVDEANGYRYYAAAQLSRLNRLIAFRDLGFGLDEIAELLEADAATVRDRLARRRAELAASIEAQQHRLIAVDARLSLIEADHAADGSDVADLAVVDLAFVDKALPRLRLVQLRGDVEDAGQLGREVGSLFQQLTSRLGYLPAGPSYAWYDSTCDPMRFGVGYPAGTVSDALLSDSPSDTGSSDTETSCADSSCADTSCADSSCADTSCADTSCADTSCADTSCTHSSRTHSADVGGQLGDLPAEPDAVTVIHQGRIEQIGSTWQALAREVDARGLEIAGPGREVYHELGLADPDGWVVEVQLPVRG